MKFSTPFGFTALLILFIGSFFLEGCTDPDLEGDPRKLSIYRVDIKRTDVEIEDILCRDIPADPCYCLTDTTGGTSYITVHVKNCDESTADSISITSELHAGGRSYALTPVSTTSTLAHDAGALFVYSTTASFTSVDSIVYDLQYWAWTGSSVLKSFDQTSFNACSTNCP